MAIPMITARTLGDMPALIEDVCGLRALAVTFEKCGLPFQLRDDRRYFIPQASLKAFVAAGSRQLGEEYLGLLAAPVLSVRDYGLWGDYVLSGATLDDALHRARSALCYHSSYDQVEIIPGGDQVWFSYLFAESHGEGYDNISFIALAVMLSIVRGYLGGNWTPPVAELNIPRRRCMSEIEQTFGCDVRLGEGTVAFPVPFEALATPIRSRPRVTLTLQDVARDRQRRPPSSIADVVAELIRIQLTEGQPALDDVARTLRLGPRTLQRRLDRWGLQFRTLANEVKIGRARALLREPDISVTQVATEMSYSSVANFSRAFQKRTNLTPSQYRREWLTRTSGTETTGRKAPTPSCLSTGSKGAAEPSFHRPVLQGQPAGRR